MLNKLTGLVVLFFMIVAGGVYYYFGIYAPRTYITGLVRAYGDFVFAMDKLDPARIVDERDYETILIIINEIEHDLEDVDKYISKTPPPQRTFREAHKSFSEAVTFSESLLGKIRNDANFYNNFVGSLGIFLDECGFYCQSGRVVKYGEVSEFLNKTDPEIIAQADKSFEAPPVSLKGTSLNELKTSWQIAKNDLNTILIFMRSANHELPAATSWESLRTQVGTRPLEKAATERLIVFFESIKALTANNDPAEILQGFPFEDSPEGNFSEHIKKMNQFEDILLSILKEKQSLYAEVLEKVFIKQDQKLQSYLKEDERYTPEDIDNAFNDWITSLGAI